MKKILLIIFFISTFLPAQEQFTSSHQRDWEYFRNNPELVGTTIASPSFSKRDDFEKAQTLNKVVYGFHPYWQNGSESNYYFSLLTHVAYFSADINASTGGFTTTNSWASANVVAQAKLYGVKVHLCLVLFSNHATFLTSTAAKNALIANTLAQLALRGADGVNIDFESMAESNRDNFRTFMRQFGDSLKSHGYEFVIELPAVDWSSISDGIGLFDATFFAALNPVTDFYFCMLYDYYWSGSPTAGPNAPLRASNITSTFHVLRSIDRYLNTGCPANKFIAGFPNYGRDWRVKNTNALADTLGSSPSVSRTYTVVKNNYIDTIPAERQFWSSTYNTRYYNYVSDGNWRQTWYDDSTSLGMKFDSIKVKNVAGTGFWALGYDGSEPEIWGAVKTAFAQTANPAHTSFDNFETSVGHFTTSPTFSGSTVGIAASSTSALTNDAANNGAQSLLIVLKDNASLTTDWTVRHLSGSGSRANNIQFSNSGYIGFWMKTNTTPNGAQVALAIDDQRNGAADRTELSAKINVINDGKWNLYQWQLSGSGWTSFAGGNGVLDSSTLSLDAVMFYAPNNSPDWTIYFDDVSHNASSPLPVELENFSAFNKQLQVHLHWKTISELNNYGFEIQRSVISNQSSVSNSQPTDNSQQPKASEWLCVGFVEGSGTTNPIRSYTFTDAVTKPGIYSYRLRQIDRNGSYRYSAEMNVNISGYPETYSLEQNYPNPFNPTTTIQFVIPDNGTLQNVSLKIYDLLGREVATVFNGEKEAGIHSVQWNAAGCASGVYFYTLSSGEYSATKKLLLLK